MVSKDGQGQGNNIVVQGHDIHCDNFENFERLGKIRFENVGTRLRIFCLSKSLLPQPGSH